MIEQLAQGRLTARIVVGLITGLATGVAINVLAPTGVVHEVLVEGLFYVLGSIFIASLKLLVVPLVFVSLVCGTAALDDISKLGRVGGRTLALYLLTTAGAISLALLLAALVAPGAGFDLPSELSYEPREAPSVTDTLIALFPTNPVRAMAEANMLQIIVFAILFGLAVTLAGEPGARLLSTFRDANSVVLRLVLMLVHLAPYGVFCLIARVFATQGFGAIQHLAQYFFVVLAALLLHAGLVYPLLLRVLGGLSPRSFFRKMRDPMALAFSTASSNATLPVTLENAEHRLGVSNGIASFTVPLGATINMDGTAIMQGVATVFIAQAYGFDIGMQGYLMVVLTATLASIGTAGVPGVGLVMLAMVLEQVSLPVEGIALIIGVDRLLDMVRTAVNVTGDSAVACVVARSEGQLDEEVFLA
ncbi:MAG: dicarboxylate/amino acid:cation symporter [Myxococcota bacterium]|nr:dicarboxylate/amino acid:cation symporter [Myxococcota bacterium]